MLIKKVNDDLDELLEIWLQVNIQCHDFIEQNYWQQNKDFVKQALPHAMLFCEKENVIKGFLGICDGYIEGLFVRKEFQKQGIGKNLIEEAKQYFDTLSLHVYLKNENAIAFYKHMGFVIKQQDIQQETKQEQYFMIWTKN